MLKDFKPFQIPNFVLFMFFVGFVLVPQIGAQSVLTSEERIATEVQAALDELPEGQMITVIVTLVEQADLSQIPGATRAARQQGVIRALQAKANATQQQIKAFLNVWQNRGEVAEYDSFWVFNGLSVTASEDIILELAARADVLRITPDDITILPTFAQTGSSAEPNLYLIQAPSFWELGYDGQGIVVANMDSGVDLNHPDLSNRWRGGDNSWFDPHGENATPTDLTGHGTWTMGVMVGADTGGSVIGVAPQAQWIAVKIFDNSGFSTATSIHQGFQWLMDPDGDPNTADAPHVVNNSWTMGYPGCDLEFELDLASLRAIGVLPIFAAGNFGPGAGTSASPANNPSALAVGGVNNSDLILAESSRGPASCGESTAIFPELVAPGDGIRTSDLYGLYTNESGTSMAAPHVAGGLALLLHAFPDLSASRQENAIISGAVDLGLSGADNDNGHGRIDLLASYQWLQNNPVPPTATATVTPSVSNNLALNQPVSVSSFQDSEHVGAMAVDGDLLTLWQTARANGKNTSTSEWIEVDLGTIQNVDKVVLQWDENYATTYSVQVSNDNSSWTTVHTTDFGNGNEDIITFTAVTARFVRLESTGWVSDRWRSWLREFEIYNTGGNNSTPTPAATATATSPTATLPPPTETSPPPTATANNSPSIHVGDLNAASFPDSKNRWQATISVTIHDQYESLAAGATVEGSWGSDASGSGSCITDSTGTCTITKSNINNGKDNVSFTVNAVSLNDRQYVPLDNHDPDGESDGSSISVAKP